MDRLTAFVCIAHLRLRLDILKRNPHLLESAAMPIELKGLRAKALKAASNLDALNAAYDAFNEAAPAHTADVAGLSEQVGQLGDDLKFAAQVLGNSVAQSNVTEAEAQQPERLTVNGVSQS